MKNITNEIFRMELQKLHNQMETMQITKNVIDKIFDDFDEDGLVEEFIDVYNFGCRDNFLVWDDEYREIFMENTDDVLKIVNDNRRDYNLSIDIKSLVSFAIDRIFTDIYFDIFE